MIVEPTAPDDPTGLEARLRASRPEPSALFVRETQERLLERAGRRTPVWQPRATWVGLGLSAGLAGVVLALSLAGIGPMAGDQNEVEAVQLCRGSATRELRPSTILKVEEGVATVVQGSRQQILPPRCP